MRAVLDHLTADDEIGLVSFGQSNRNPNGDRDTEGYVEAPHLKLRACGMDLTIAAIVSSNGSTHGAIATRSVVSVSEALVLNDWVNGELRLVQHEYGDSVASSLRRGHAKVISNTAVAANTTDGAVGGTLVFDLTNDRVIWIGHGRPNGSQVLFATTNTLPGLTAGAIYYVRDADENGFKVAASPWGTAIDLVGGTGTHTITARACLVVEWVSAFQVVQAGVTFTLASPGVVNQTAHGYTAGSTVSYDINLPAALTPGTKYFVIPVNANSYNLSATLGGAAINFASSTGPATATPDTMAFVAGYVHLHDRFNSYDNVQVVTPYQPIAPGDYPAGVPFVPGFTLASDVTSFADLGLVLPYAWNEGVDGYGAFGTCTVAALVVTLGGGQTIEDALFAGGFIRVGNAKGKIASNNTTTVTVESWTPTAGPGVGTLAYELHLPHWRNNPHHFTAGEGFLYPSSCMQPGGGLPSSLGLAYSRPRAQLTSGYVTRSLQTASASTAINSTGLPVLKTNGSGQLTCSIVGGKLRVQRATNTRDPASQLIQFEDFVRPGYIIGLIGTGQTPSVDTFWRCTAMQHATAAAGSYIDLDVVAGVVGAVPGSVTGTVPANATITRMFWKPKHGFGSLIELCWRMAVAIGRRLVVAHLAVNAAGQIAAETNNATGFQGKLGWWDDDLDLDWTPSNPDGAAARLKRVVEFIAPRAVTASLGTKKKWKVLALDSWGSETDTLTVAGRELARRSLPTFVAWLRALITAAGLSPYPTRTKIPLQWAKIAKSPWEIAGLGGDVDGAVNAALARMVALDGFAASVDVDTEPKVDPLHFNGIGEVHNGANASKVLLPLIDFALSFKLGPAAIALANEALSIVGDTANVTSLEPPNATVQATRCAAHMPQALALTLQHQPWTFASRRVAPVAIENTVSTWAYAYAVPPDLLYPTAVLAPDSPDDLQIRAVKTIDMCLRWGQPTLQPASQPHTIETDQEGNRVLRTDQADAVLIYVARNVDVELWDPLVRQSGAYRLAHLLSGPTVKGKSSIAIGQGHLQMAIALANQAASSNAEYQRDVRPQAGCPWLP